MKPLRGVSFDLNDTLLDGSGGQDAIRCACGEIAAKIGVDAPRLFQANAEVWQRYWPEVQDKWTLGILDGKALSLEAWRRTLLACGCDDESLARLARETHVHHWRAALRMFDDAQAVLDLLEPHYRLALITNGASDTQRTALRALGIEDRFDAIVISGEVGIAKPDAAIFRLAADRLGLQPESVWHVGDSLRTDVAGARAAGVVAIWLNRPGARRESGEPEPEHEIRSLKGTPRACPDGAGAIRDSWFFSRID